MNTPSNFRIILMLTIVILAGACKKRAIEMDTGLPGVWELKEYSGYPFPPPYPPGNGNLIKIYSDFRFERTDIGPNGISGTFTLSHKKDCYPRTNDLLIKFHSDIWEEESYVKVHKENGEDELWLGSSNCLQDYGEAIYRRIQ